MDFHSLVLEELIVPKLKRGMKVKLPDEIVNRIWHSIKDPYGYITNVKKETIGAGSDSYDSGFAYRVEFIDTDKRMTKALQKTMSRVNKYYSKYGTNSWCYIDGKLLEDTNAGLAIKQSLTPNTKETFGGLIDEL